MLNRRKVLFMIACIVVLAIFPVASVLLNGVSIQSSGVIAQSESGSILFADSFERDDVGAFDFYDDDFCPDGWGPDIGPVGATPLGPYYGEVVQEGVLDSTGLYGDAQDGDKSVKLIHSGVEGGTNWVLIWTYEAGDYFGQGVRTLYVSWYQKMLNFPQGYNEYVVLSQTIGGGSVHETNTAMVEIRCKGNTGAPSEQQIGLMYMWNWLDQSLYNNRKEITVYPGDFGLGPLQIDRWYRFEVLYKWGRGDGEYRFWLDGVELVSYTGLDNSPMTIEDGELIKHDPDTDANWEYYLPKGVDVGAQTTIDTSFVTYIDNFIFADTDYYRPLLYYRGFEFPDFDIGDRYNYDSLITDGHRQIVDSSDNNQVQVPLSDRYPTSYRFVQGQIHSGSQAFYSWGLKETQWTRDFTPLHYTGSEYFEFSGGPYDSLVNITIGQLPDERLLADTDKYESGQVYRSAMPGTYHWASEWLLWDGVAQKYYATIGQAFPRDRIGVYIKPTSDVYASVYFNLKSFGKATNLDPAANYIQVLRTWNGDYVSQVFVEKGYQGWSIKVELGSSKSHQWTPYELVNGIRTPIPGINGGEVARSSLLEVELGKWYYIEHRFKMSNPGEYNGGVEVWFAAEGQGPQKVIDRMDLDTSEAEDSIYLIQAGFVTCNGEIEAFFDDFAISSSYLGPFVNTLKNQDVSTNFRVVANIRARIDEFESGKVWASEID